jgi:hypothetical protein
MNRDLTTRGFLAMACALALSGHATAEPPNVVVSDSDGNTAMGTEALFGVTASGGQFDVYGLRNTAAGYRAMYSASAATDNTAFGIRALFSTKSGINNTGVGDEALFSSDSNDDTAVGYFALHATTSGVENTAIGSYSATSNTTGSYNTVLGFESLYQNTTANGSTAVGTQTLYANTTGSANSAIGMQALFANTTGLDNSGIGSYALNHNVTGNFNTATGNAALQANTVGSDNTASGRNSLRLNTTGSANIALGANAGYNLTTGSNNIEIGNQGLAGENATIRIGAPSVQTAAYIAGITGSHVTGSAVYISSSGQLGVLASSERYKTAIAPIAEAGKLARLRPVSFHLKNQPQGELQYGLIAEEVAKVYPELVVHDEAGNIEGVRYDELAPLLLVQLQQQKAQLESQERELREMKLAISRLGAKRDGT